ncbi:peptidylprolyl isomerase [Acidocella sp.]|uniref:peptidylprolyl isomerase n=1 Tax=Acidocella sp. TaxID=50710 RepID=UPI00261E34D0|nr:peptidylprolyl isomerase [Acidocella sp.]
MLVQVRKLMGGWGARVFFGVLVVAFVGWGVSNVLTLVGGDSAVARVAGVPVDVSLVQADYQKLLNQAAQQAGGQPSLAVRQQLAMQALVGALRNQVMRAEAAKLGVATPDAAVRAQLAAIPQFQTNGAFDKAKFTQALAQINVSPDEFIGEIKDGLISRQIMVPVLGGVQPSGLLMARLFALLAQQRTPALVSIPFSAQAKPAAPTDAVLQRYWRNHPALFTAPQYRKIELVILAPALLAPTEPVASQDVDAALARAEDAAGPVIPERTVQVLSVPDLAASSRLEAAWKKGADWAKMQDLAKKYGANAIELDNASAQQIPEASLAKAVFAADSGKVTGPVAGDAGMYVFKVTGEAEVGTPPAVLRAQVTQQLQLQAAQNDVAGRLSAVQDALAAQTPLDQLPGNLGLTALSGTLDAEGNTPEGVPAPIPGGDDLKAAILKAAFAANKGDPAQLQNGPDGSYFALSVDDVIAPAVEPYATAKPQVLAAWTQDQIEREAEVTAAGLYETVTKGQNLADAAKAAGLSATTAPPVARGAAPAAGSGIDQNLVSLLFSLKPGQATMEKAATGYVVAQLMSVNTPTPAQDPQDYQKLSAAMTRGLQNDLAGSFLDGLQTRFQVTINQKMLAQLYQ